MQLKQALALHGYTVVDFYNRLARRYVVTYQQIARYCRCDNRSHLDPVIWSWIMGELKEMGVEWSGR